MEAAIMKALSLLKQMINSMAKQEEEEKENRLIATVIVGIFAFIVFITLCSVQLAILPENMMLEHFLPDEIASIQNDARQAITRPTISTSQQSFLPLPTALAHISSPYGYRILWGSENWHEGIDFPVAQGTPVVSVANGIVIYTETNPMYGHCVLIQHKAIYKEKEKPSKVLIFYSFYAHLSQIYVVRGQAVTARQQIALSGGDPNAPNHFAGNSDGAHLHFEIRQAVEYGSQTDPYDYVLKPLNSDDKKRLRNTTFHDFRKGL